MRCLHEFVDDFLLPKPILGDQELLQVPDELLAVFNLAKFPNSLPNGALNPSQESTQDLTQDPTQDLTQDLTQVLGPSPGPNPGPAKVPRPPQDPTHETTATCEPDLVEQSGINDASIDAPGRRGRVRICSNAANYDSIGNNYLFE